MPASSPPPSSATASRNSTGHLRARRWTTTWSWRHPRDTSWRRQAGRGSCPVGARSPRGLASTCDPPAVIPGESQSCLRPGWAHGAFRCGPAWLSPVIREVVMSRRPLDPDRPPTLVALPTSPLCLDRWGLGEILGRPGASAHAYYRCRRAAEWILYRRALPLRLLGVAVAGPLSDFAARQVLPASPRCRPPPQLHPSRRRQQRTWCSALLGMVRVERRAGGEASSVMTVRMRT